MHIIVANAPTIFSGFAFCVSDKTFAVSHNLWAFLVLNRFLERFPVVGSSEQLRVELENRNKHSACDSFEVPSTVNWPDECKQILAQSTKDRSCGVLIAGRKCLQRNGSS